MESPCNCHIHSFTCIRLIYSIIETTSEHESLPSFPRNFNDDIILDALLPPVRLPHLSLSNIHMLRLRLKHPPISLTLSSLPIPRNLSRPLQFLSLIHETLILESRRSSRPLSLPNVPLRRTTFDSSVSHDNIFASHRNITSLKPRSCSTR